MKRFNNINGIKRGFRKLSLPKDIIPYQFKFKGKIFTQKEYDEAGKVLIYQANEEIDEEGTQFIDICTSERYGRTGMKDTEIDLY